MPENQFDLLLFWNMPMKMSSSAQSKAGQNVSGHEGNTILTIIVQARKIDLSYTILCQYKY